MPSLKRISFAVTVAALVALSLLGMTGASAAPPPAPSPHETTVGISIDSEDGGTSTSIECGRDGSFQTVDGDGTLLLANRVPHRMTCTITIRSN